MFPEFGCPWAGKNSIPHHTGGIQLVQGNLQRPGQWCCTVPLQRDSRLMPETQNYLHGFHLFFCFKTLQGLLFQSSAFLFCLFGFLIVRKKGISQEQCWTPLSTGALHMESTDHLNINALFCGLWLSLSLTHGQQDNIWDTSELSVAFLGTVCSTADGTMGKKPKKQTNTEPRQRL